MADNKNNDWNVGDMFTTPETNGKCFTVYKVSKNDVEAFDSRSASGYTIFAKSYVTKVWDINKSLATKKTQAEIEKYDTIEKIVEQLQKCNYECEAGCLNNNVAFIALKRMANTLK